MNWDYLDYEMNSLWKELIVLAFLCLSAALISAIVDLIKKNNPRQT
jgi:hypothetical protein